MAFHGLSLQQRQQPMQNGDERPQAKHHNKLLISGYVEFQRYYLKSILSFLVNDFTIIPGVHEHPPVHRPDVEGMRLRQYKYPSLQF